MLEQGSIGGSEDDVTVTLETSHERGLARRTYVIGLVRVLKFVLVALTLHSRPLQTSLRRVAEQVVRVGGNCGIFTLEKVLATNVKSDHGMCNYLEVGSSIALQEK